MELLLLLVPLVLVLWTLELLASRPGLEKRRRFLVRPIDLQLKLTYTHGHLQFFLLGCNVAGKPLSSNSSHSPNSS